MTQRREVKSPFTKEERQGVFVTREESRERRNKLTKQRRTLRSKQPENKIETEQEFKEDLKYRMEQGAQIAKPWHTFMNYKNSKKAKRNKFIQMSWRLRKSTTIKNIHNKELNCLISSTVEQLLCKQ